MGRADIDTVGQLIQRQLPGIVGGNIVDDLLHLMNGAVIDGVLFQVIRNQKDDLHKISAAPEDPVLMPR
ncbi:hypothetical protein D3C76_1460630 [compost metagenome]